MHRFMTGSGALLFGVLLLACVGAPGCFCFSQPPRESIIEQPPPVPDTFTYLEMGATSDRPAPRVSEAPSPPPPAVPTSPAMPPAVAGAIEDLSQKYPGLFTFDREKGLCRFNSDITFDSGSAVVKPAARAALGKLAEILSVEQVSDRGLTVIGFTDTDRVRKADTIARLRGLGKSADNMGLSEARAEAVAEILKAGGVEAGRIVTRGRGEAEPIAENRTPQGKARNRRVEIYIAGAGRATRGGAAPGGVAVETPAPAPPADAMLPR